MRRCENGSTHVVILVPLPLTIYFFDKSLDTDNVDIGNDADDNTYCESAVFDKTKKDLIKTTVVICEKKKMIYHSHKKRKDSFGNTDQTGRSTQLC